MAIQEEQKTHWTDKVANNKVIAWAVLLSGVVNILSLALRHSSATQSSVSFPDINNYGLIRMCDGAEDLIKLRIDFLEKARKGELNNSEQDFINYAYDKLEAARTDKSQPLVYLKPKSITCFSVGSDTAIVEIAGFRIINKESLSKFITSLLNGDKTLQDNFGAKKDVISR